jgi:hypothetical protein
VPRAFTAATRKRYSTPAASPVTVALLSVDAPSTKVVHPLDTVAYCTT